MRIDDHLSTPKLAKKPKVEPTKDTGIPGAPHVGSGPRPIVDGGIIKGAGEPTGLGLEAFPAMNSKAFQALDKNHDGVLTGTEIKNKAGDRNGDGKVTMAEFQRNRAHDRAQQDMKKLDKNHDGILSGTELKQYKDADRNGDGSVTKRELNNFLAKATGVTSEDMFNAFDGNGDAVLSGNELKKEQLERWDVDGDGKVTKEEFKTSRMEHWKEARFKDDDRNADGFLSGNEIQKDLLERLDTDKDGRVSKEEWMATPKKTVPDTPPITDGVPHVPFDPPVTKIRADDPLPGPFDDGIKPPIVTKIVADDPQPGPTV